MAIQRRTMNTILGKNQFITDNRPKSGYRGIAKPICGGYAPTRMARGGKSSYVATMTAPFATFTSDWSEASVEPYERQAKGSDTGHNNT